MYRKLIKPLLFSLTIERAHRVALLLLRGIGLIPGGLWLLRKCYAVKHPALEREVFGIRFPNPVGLAAGFDRNGEALRPLSALGFGFVEIGTVTPRPQAGNPRPRVFRLPKDRAIVNRIGIANRGLDATVRHLRRGHEGILVGCNIGKNTDTPPENAPADYLRLFRNLYQYADYFTVNISCDNACHDEKTYTRGHLLSILDPLFDFRRGQSEYRPVMLKISPDLSDETIDLMTDIMLDTPLDGMVAVNATVSREGVDRLEATRIGAGVVSGQPLTQRALEVVRRIHTRSGGNFPIIGVGGIMSPADAKAMLDAGADLLQLYTGYIYEGPGLVGEICRSLIADAEAAAAAKAAAEARAEEEARAAAQAAEAKAAAATASGAQAPEAGKAAPGTETAAAAQTQAAAPAESVPNPSPETQNGPARPADNEPDTRKKQPAS